jgi:hypothetical protein
MCPDNLEPSRTLLPRQYRPYLDLLAKALTNYLYLGESRKVSHYAAIMPETYSDSRWKIGKEAIPHTLLHKAQLNNIEACIFSVVRDGIPGDIIEAGVFRGGAAIYMRAVLGVLGVTDRCVWLADTFAGIPRAERYTDVNDPVNDWDDRWSADIDQVRNTFARYDMLDQQVRFLQGPFSTTLHPPPFGDLAVARLDADAYESTRDAIESIYPKLQPGGYIIIDDWHLPSCRRAIMEYRKEHGINDEILGVVVDGTDKTIPIEAFWRVGSHSAGLPA